MWRPKMSLVTSNAQQDVSSPWVLPSTQSAWRVLLSCNHEAGVQGWLELAVQLTFVQIKIPWAWWSYWLLRVAAYYSALAESSAEDRTDKDFRSMQCVLTLGDTCEHVLWAVTWVCCQKLFLAHGPICKHECCLQTAVTFMMETRNGSWRGSKAMSKQRVRVKKKGPEVSSLWCLHDSCQQNPPSALTMQPLLPRLCCCVQTQHCHPEVCWWIPPGRPPRQPTAHLWWSHSNRRPHHFRQADKHSVTTQGTSKCPLLRFLSLNAQWLN